MARLFRHARRVARSGVDPDYAAVPNRCYSRALDAVAEAVKNRNWPSYIWLHKRPYRLDAFVEIADGLSNEEFWTELSDIWTDIDFAALAKLGGTQVMQRPASKQPGDQPQERRFSPGELCR